MKFAATITPTTGDPYYISNSPQDIVRWESQAAKNNVEALRKMTSVMQILHIAALREGKTEHKAFTDWLAGLEAFDMEQAEQPDPTVEAQPAG
jgi:hypothetical protein